MCAMPGPPRRPDAPDVMWSGSGGGDLPAGADQLASERDRDHAGGLAAAFAQQLPARVQSALDAPGLIDHGRVLAAVADRELAADRRCEAVVQRGLDQQPASVA